MTLKMIPYGRQNIRLDDVWAVIKVLKSDWLTQGPKVAEFERQVASFVGAKHAIAVANGTAALHLAVAALNLEPGSEGITTANTFVATPNAMLYNRIKPDLADIDKDTYNISLSDVEKRLNEKTKLLLPVHFAGLPVDMDRLKSIAASHDLHVIEDAAHAIGATYTNGARVGSCRYSDMTIFSFHPVKTITTGEGGLITTNSDAYAEKLMALRTHGISKDPLRHAENAGLPWYYELQHLGFNYRITDIQCALGSAQFKKLRIFLDRRREIASMYERAFADLEHVQRPFIREGHGLHLYILQIDFDAIPKSRTSVMMELRARGIGTQVHYIPVYKQPYYQEKFDFDESNYPNTETYYKRCLSIPLYPAMTNSDVRKVVREIHRACRP